MESEANLQSVKFEMEICLILILSFMLYLKLPSLQFPHNEFDEMIYVSLTKQIYYNGTYSLRGTQILSHLSTEIWYPFRLS
jgi:hypothetical protein